MVPQDNQALGADAPGEAALSDDDRIAIDFLLNRRDGSDEAAPHSMAAGDGTFADRVEFFGSVMKLLNEIPVTDPPADLLERLAARIDAAPAGAAVYRELSLPPGAGAGDELIADEA